MGEPVEGGSRGGIGISASWKSSWVLAVVAVVVVVVVVVGWGPVCCACGGGGSVGCGVCGPTRRDGDATCEGGRGGG